MCTAHCTHICSVVTFEKSGRHEEAKDLSRSKQVRSKPTNGTQSDSWHVT
jgi:hypothetical protein